MEKNGERSQISREMEAGSKSIWSKEYKGIESKLQKSNEAYAKAERQISKSKHTLERLSNSQQKNGTLTEKQAQTQRRASEELRKNIRLQEKATNAINHQEKALSKLQNRVTGAGHLWSGAVSFGVYRSADLVSSLAGNVAQKQFSGESGQIVNGTISGIMAGAALGSVIPGVGTIVGGIVGGLAGVWNEQFKIDQQNEEEIQAIAEQHFSQQLDEMQQNLASGMSKDSLFEKTKIQFSKRFGGDQEADQLLQALQELSFQSPYNIEQLISMAHATGDQFSNINEMLAAFQQAGDVGFARGMSNQEIAGLASKIGSMKDLDATDPALVEALEGYGIVASEDETIWDLLKRYDGTMKQLNNSYYGKQEEITERKQMTGVWQARGYAQETGATTQSILKYYRDNGEKQEELYVRLGQEQGILPSRTTEEWIRTQKEFLQSDLPPKGQIKTAMIENSALALIRTQISPEYESFQQQDEKAIGTLKTMLGGKYTDSDEISQQIKKIQELELEINSLIHDLSLNSDYTQSYFEMSSKGKLEKNFFNIEFSLERKQHDLWELKNNLSGMVREKRHFYGEDILYDINRLLGESYSSSKTKNNSSTSGAAFGIPYVPYDGYRVWLHEGERVLTAQEARGYDKGGVGGVTVHVHGMTVQERADIDRVATQLYEKIRIAQMIS